MSMDVSEENVDVRALELMSRNDQEVLFIQN